MKSLNGMLLLFLCVAGAHAEVYRVDDDSTSPNPNGASWASAFSSIRDAVQAAHQAGGGEVWVAEGTYTGSAGNPIDSGGAAAGDTSLILLEGVHVYGGFSGVESLREARDWQDHPTIIDGQNVRRCVFSSGIPYGGATLDGFTVRRGHTVEFGGGLYNDQSAPLVANCRFENNHAALHGGGVFNYKSPALLFAGRSLYDTEIAEQAGLDLVPAFSGVVFQNNSAVYGGGGVYSDANFLVLERCVFDGNTAGVGGGMYDKGGKTEFFRTTFQNNTATDAGAGYCYEGTSTTEFTNCLLNDNNSGTTGGGIYHDGYRVSLTHTTVAKNSAPQGGGVFGGQAFSLALNTIAYDNGATNIDDASDSPFTMLASCLEFEPADPAQGVINVDPLFLKPQLGFFGLASNSPALDAGISGWINVLDDLNGAPRPQGPEVDMGALEDHTPPVVTDSDNDGLLDAWEIEHFGNLNQNGQEDFDNDGLTNAEEFENQTDPTDADSDNDGHNDGAEVNDGRDPNDPGDYPGLVVFADPNLEAAVRSAINLPLGPIWVSDVVGVGFTSLTATNSAIQDLSGLEYCTDLTSVNFNRNLITDLTPLASLPNLTTAYISSNEVYDLGPLAMNTSIKRLLMENNHLSDVSPLAFMSQLTELTLNNNAISNIGPLAALPNLQSLSLIRNGITSFAALSGMTSLKELRIRENAITSIVPVNGLPNIELFDVSYNSVSVIPSGLQLPKLRVQICYYR
ncbi:MAG: leucine-rich repeat domain-containing protein [Candidatus Hydrogenedentes bacterium]|nr:leucine-rich repeat domain-containing protein [Candidatus Hydrogenedentota bacterium]